MKTTGEIRILVTELLNKLTRDKIQKSDVRWLKANNGVFPLKMIWIGTPGELDSTFKETPYQPSDLFVLFDVLQEKNIASENLGSKITSMLPFRVIINIYGDDCEDEVQHIMSSLHKPSVRQWMFEHQIALTAEPDEFQVLDGRENASWWKRRRLELLLNTPQVIEFGEDEEAMSIEDIKHKLTVVGGN